jgi:hypothetical protein
LVTVTVGGAAVQLMDTKGTPVVSAPMAVLVPSE